MFRRHFDAPDTSYFLFGPRGCGKTTWYRDYYGESARVFDLLDPETFRDLSARPELLRSVVEAHRGKGVFVLDEIQRIPEVLPVVHSLIFEYPSARFVLTGSSSRKLKRRGVDMLAGRALVTRMHPLTASELGDSFDLDTTLSTGLVPLVFCDPDPARRLRSYVSLYVQEEVKYEGLTRNIGNFSRFLTAAALSHAQVLNISAIARECRVERKVVESYLLILEDLNISRRIPAFHKRARRRITNHPKLYLLDAGVFRTLRPAGPLDTPGTISGAALEGVVEHHIRAWIDYAGVDADCYFWRTPAGTEVDFVVYGADTFAAIEVKHTTRVRPEDLRGLSAFRQDYPEATPLLLYRGSRRLKEQGILCVPVAEYLKSLGPDTPLVPPS